MDRLKTEVFARYHIHKRLHQKRTEAFGVSDDLSFLLRAKSNLLEEIIKDAELMDEYEEYEKDIADSLNKKRTKTNY